MPRNIYGLYTNAKTVNTSIIINFLYFVTIASKLYAMKNYLLLKILLFL